MTPLLIILLLAVLAAAPFWPLGALAAALALSAFLPTVPETAGETAVMMAYAGVLAVAVVLRASLHLVGGVGRIPLEVIPGVGVALAVFAAANAVVGVAAGVPLVEWARGAAPFLPVLLCLTIPRSEWGRLATVALPLVGAIGVGYAAYALALSATLPVRLTAADYRTLVPWASVGAMVWLALAHGWSARRRAVAVALAVLCLAGVLVSMTRGLIFATAAGIGVLAVAAARRRGRSMGAGALAALVLLAAGAAVALALPSPSVEGIGTGEYVARRLFDAGTIRERFAEIGLALDVWKGSPLLGQGLGFRYETTGLLGYRGESVSYVHNAVAYFLMTSGLMGLALYASLYLGPLRRLFDRGVSPWQLAAVASLVCMGLYSLTSAAFRLFQFNLLLGIMMMVASFGGAGADGERER